MPLPQNRRASLGTHVQVVHDLHVDAQRGVLHHAVRWWYPPGGRQNESRAQWGGIGRSLRDSLRSNETRQQICHLTPVASERMVLPRPCQPIWLIPEVVQHGTTTSWVD
ncbi:unnamed protein product, partial [Iphiclides podalirius]